MENAPGPDGHADPQEPPVDRDEAEDRGVPDPATFGPEGPELHDQVGHPGPDGSPRGATRGGPAPAGGPPAVPEAAHPVTGDLSARPQPAGGFGPTRTDVPPHAE